CPAASSTNLMVCGTITGIDTINSCGSYSWIDGITYTENNSTATFNIEGGAANGCDSLVTLNLTIQDCVANNECVDAVNLSVPVWPSVNNTLGTVYQASNTGAVSCASATGGDVFYSFSAAEINHYIVTVNPFGGFD